VEVGESLIISPGFEPRDHSLVDGEYVGNVVGEDGEPIVGEMSDVPLSGPLPLSSIGQHLLNQNKMWMDNGYMKDLAQRPERTQTLSNYYGATWGSPHTTIDMGAGGMTVYKWDWRYDGDPNTSGAGNSTSGPWGDTTHYAELNNNSKMSSPGAYGGNGYFEARSGQMYRLSFNFDQYRKTHSSHSSYMAIAVYGYLHGYLNGTRVELLSYQNFNPLNNPSGSKSYQFGGNTTYNHTVVNFTWWCPGWSGVTEGIKCAIIDAKVTRVS
jgi:hypothetical protein